MRWTPGDRSNVEDARGRGVGIAGLGSVGIGGFLLLALLSPGANPASTTAGNTPPASTTPAEEREVDFVDAVTKDVQTTWQTILARRYQPTRVVLFRDAIDSACGMAGSATGPF